MEDVIQFLQDEVVRCHEKAWYHKKENRNSDAIWYNNRADAMTKAISILEKENNTETYSTSKKDLCKREVNSSLPNDEDILGQACSVYLLGQDTPANEIIDMRLAYEKGAKWMRDLL